MSEQNWLKQVAQSLRHRGLSPRYIRRFTDELADHYQDLFMETRSMDAKLLSERLGAPAELADRAVHEMRGRSYAGRHPLITFIAAPLPATAVLLIGFGLAFLAALSLVPETSVVGESIPGWAAVVLTSIVWAMRFLPFVAGAALFCWLASRALCAPRWSFAACALVGILAGLFAINLTLPTAGPGSGSLTLGFSIPPGAMQLFQAVAPMAIWGIFAWREFARDDSEVAT
jgi:hypothetical protein